MTVDPDFSRAPVLEGIPSASVERIRSRGRDLRFDSNQLLFRRGDAAEDLMILREGVVGLFFPIHILGADREITLENKEAGDLVAWSALVPPHRFTLSARCTAACEVTALSREVLLDEFQRDPQVGYLFMRNLAGVIGRRLELLQTSWLADLQSRAVE